jgi:splicing factor U2AF subunit
MKPSSTPGDQVLSAWISTDGHYAFVEFRSAEEASNGFLLNNISILGQPLKVGRPKTWQGEENSIQDGVLPNTVGAVLQAGTMSCQMMGRKVTYPTRILMFSKLIDKIDLFEEYADICDDIKEECSKYGRVMTIHIPREGEIGYGNCYLEFYTVEEAKEARKVTF